ncbi:hypothetical protein CSW64_03495 [Caulobacter mirabilis]|uniref:HTH tetR-type domain-containing protein n=2 Tax=Caulobacter mirabilis TaxID=69666 RepID=A0A2D2AU50_9CAUL|nr:hypothetical protein CSW64_03495 [Caulobacter mirabilis]
MMSIDARRSNRDRLVHEARRLFTDKGYADVSVDEVAAAAGLTKGAVYYQFKDKTDLFRAACAALLAEIGAALDRGVMGEVEHSVDEIVAGGDQWLDICEAPEVRRLLLVDGPSVLGVEGWNALLEPLGVGLIAHALDHLVEAGLLDADAVPALSHVLLGAFVQGALRIAASPDPQATGREVRHAIRLLTEGLTQRRVS